MGGKFSVGGFSSGSLPAGMPSFKTGRIANGTGDAYMGGKDGTGSKDLGEGKSDKIAPGEKRKRRKRRKVNIKKFKGL